MDTQEFITIKDSGQLLGAKVKGSHIQTLILIIKIALGIYFSALITIVVIAALLYLATH